MIRQQEQAAIDSWLTVFFIFIVALFSFVGAKAFAWWDCGKICEAHGHGNFYRISQGCYCANEAGKPYNPRRER